MPRAHLLELVVRPCGVRHCPLQAHVAVDLVKVLPELWEAHGCVSDTWGCRRFVFVRAPRLPSPHPTLPQTRTALRRFEIWFLFVRERREGKGGKGEKFALRQVEAGRFGGEKVVFVAAGGCHTVAVTAAAGG